RSLWLDGKLIARSTQVDWTAHAPSRVVLGEFYSFPLTPTGTVDVDDFRISATPPGARLGASGPSVAQVDECVLLSIALVDSVSGAPAAAPYDASVQLRSVPPAAFFSSPGCTVATNNATLSAGASTAPIWWSAP